MSFWKSYTNLPPRTRLILGLGFMAWSAAGIMFSDRAGEAIGIVPWNAASGEGTKKEGNERKSNWGITVVDKK
ncbi:MAG: hypothetical protein M1834_006689 [Cirrosporium novae-zelandiae]|nr:MAG: hypothetical protein M1834_006689 [Cirrosporium novae-zelandiae]